MSYCIHCGQQTDNEDYICDDCRARHSAGEGGSVPGGSVAQGVGAQSARPAGTAGAEQPRPASSMPYGYYGPGYDPYAAPWVPVPPVRADRSKLPLNKCGLVGMIFSFASVFCFILMFVIVLVIISQNPQWVDNPYYEPTSGEMAGLVLSILAPLVLSFGCSVTAIVLSGVGIARYKRFRAVGFAIAGLVIGGIMFFTFISMFGIV